MKGMDRARAMADAHRARLMLRGLEVLRQDVIAPAVAAEQQYLDLPATPENVELAARVYFVVDGSVFKPEELVTNGRVAINILSLVEYLKLKLEVMSNDAVD